MPGFTEQQQAILISRGIDPSKFQPSAQTSTRPAPGVASGALPGIPEVLGKSAQRQAIPTAGALAGARAGALLPIPHPLGKLAAAFGGGVLGALGANFAQTPLTSEARTQELSQFQQQRPITSFVGQVLPSLAAFNPVKGAQNLPDLAQAVLKANPSTRRGPREIALLANAVLGVGAEVGIEGAQQIVTKDFQPGRLVAAAGTGLLLNEPNKFAQRFLKVSATPAKSKSPSLEVFKDGEDVHGIVGSEVQGPQQPAPPVTIKSIADELHLEDVTRQQAGEKLPPATFEKSLGSIINIAIKKEFPEAPPTRLFEVDPGVDDVAILAKMAGEGVIPKDKFNELFALGEAGDFAGMRSGIRNVLESKGFAGIKQGERSLPFLQEAQRGTPDAELKFQFQDSKTGKVKVLTEAELATDPSQIDALTTFDVLSPGAKALADKKGITFTTTGKELKDPKTGEKAFGIASVNTGEVAVTTTRLPHTDFHEIGHQTYDDLASSGRKVDQDFIAEGTKIFGSEENLIAAVGKEGYKFSNLEDKSLYPAALKWLTDFGSWMKYKLGFAEAADITRMFNRRMFEDAPITQAERKTKLLKSLPDTLGASIRSQSQEFKASDIASQDFDKNFLLQIGKVGIASDLDVIGNVNPTGRKLKVAFDNFYRRLSRFNGAIEDPIMERVKPFTKAQQAKVHDAWKQAALNPEDTNIGKDLNSAERGLLDDIIKWSENIFKQADELLGEVRIKEGKGFRKAIKQDNYHPDVMTQEITQTLLDRSINPEDFQRLRKEMIAHVEDVAARVLKTKAPSNPGKIFDDLVDNLARSTTGKAKPTFRALRTKTSWGIPENWTEKSLSRTIQRYSRRTARDFSYAENIESDPDILHALGLTDAKGDTPIPSDGVDVLSGNKTVLSVMKDINQDFDRGDLLIKTIDRAVKTGMLQALTGARDVVSSAYHGIANVPLKDIPKIRLTFGRIREGIKTGLENGVIKRSWLDLENPANPYNVATERINALSEIVSKVSGRTWLEMVSRGMGQSLGEQAALANLGNLGSVDKRISRQALRFFEEFGKGGELDKIQRHLKEPLSDQELQEIIQEVGSQFVEGTQGTYDPRDTPSWTREGALSPFLSLTRWSIGRANKTVDQVFKPLINDKNPEPLLKALTFGLMSGVAIEAMSELIKQRKGFAPDVREAWNSGNKTEIGSNTLGLLQLSGFGGIMSDMMKTTYDVAKGPLLGSANVQMPRGFTFPFVDALTEGATSTVDAASAIGQGAPIFNTLFRWSVDNTQNFVQNARIVSGWTEKALDRNASLRRQDFRDSAVIGRLNNIPQTDPRSFRSNPFIDRDIREARRSRDPKEKIELTKKAVQRIVEEFSDRPDVMKQKLNSLRRADRSPLAQTPLGLARQVDFILKNRGPESLNQLVMRDFQTQAANRFQKQLIPSL